MKCLNHTEEIMPPHLKSNLSELERRAALVPSFFIYKIPMAEERRGSAFSNGNDYVDHSSR